MTLSRVSIADFVSILALVPAVGLVLSLSYEYAYFLALGASISDYYSLSDLIRSAIFFILPGAPLMLIGVLFAIQVRQEDKEFPDPTGITFSHSMSKRIFLTVIIFVFLFTFLGTPIAIGISATFAATLAPRIISDYVIVPLKPSAMTYHIFYGSTALVLFFASLGLLSGSYALETKHFSGAKVYLKDGRTSAPELIRRLERGAIVFSNDKIIFVADENISRISEDMRSINFKGIVCYLHWYCRDQK